MRAVYVLLCLTLGSSVRLGLSAKFHEESSERTLRIDGTLSADVSDRTGPFLINLAVDVCAISLNGGTCERTAVDQMSNDGKTANFTFVTVVSSSEPIDALRVHVMLEDLVNVALRIPATDKNPFEKVINNGTAYISLLWRPTVQPEHEYAVRKAEERRARRNITAAPCTKNPKLHCTPSHGTKIVATPPPIPKPWDQVLAISGESKSTEASIEEEISEISVPATTERNFIEYKGNGDAFNNHVFNKTKVNSTMPIPPSVQGNYDSKRQSVNKATNAATMATTTPSSVQAPFEQVKNTTRPSTALPTFQGTDNYDKIPSVNEAKNATAMTSVAVLMGKNNDTKRQPLTPSAALPTTAMPTVQGKFDSTTKLPINEAKATTTPTSSPPTTTKAPKTTRGLIFYPATTRRTPVTPATVGAGRNATANAHVPTITPSSKQNTSGKRGGDSDSKRRNGTSTKSRDVKRAKVQIDGGGISAPSSPRPLIDGTKKGVNKTIAVVDEKTKTITIFTVTDFGLPDPSWYEGYKVGPEWSVVTVVYTPAPPVVVHGKATWQSGANGASARTGGGCQLYLSAFAVTAILAPILMV